MPQLTASGRKRCAATRRDGDQCRAPALPGDRYCFAHSPSTQTQRDAARVKGGANSAKAVRIGKLVPRTLAPVLAQLLEALEEVHAEELDPRTGSAMAAIAGAICRVYQAGTVEERIAALEERIGAETAGRRRA